MKHTLLNGRVIEISDNSIKNLMDACSCSIEEAIDIWLTDHDFIVNEKQEELDKKAKGAGFRAESGIKASKKAHEVKVSAEKQQLFNEIQSFLTEKGYDFDILTKNKLFSVKIGDKIVKIDLIQSKKATK